MMTNCLAKPAQACYILAVAPSDWHKQAAHPVKLIHNDITVLLLLIGVTCRWVAGVHALPSCRSRVVKAMAVDPTGLGSLLTRYLAPTQLPPGFEEAVGRGVQVSCIKMENPRPLIPPALSKVVHTEQLSGFAVCINSYMAVLYALQW
jgi:hypothetical protein